MHKLGWIAGPTAVCTISLSVSSTFPPGRAVSPGCERSFFDLVVSKIRKFPASSYNRTRTAARFAADREDLARRNSVTGNGEEDESDRQVEKLWIGLVLF